MYAHTSALHIHAHSHIWHSIITAGVPCSSWALCWCPWTSPPVRCCTDTSSGCSRTAWSPARTGCRPGRWWVWTRRPRTSSPSAWWSGPCWGVWKKWVRAQWSWSSKKREAHLMVPTWPSPACRTAWGSGRWCTSCPRSCHSSRSTPCSLQCRMDTVNIAGSSDGWTRCAWSDMPRKLLDCKTKLY